MRNKAFTLLEMSIVLVITSTLLTLGIGIGNFFLEQNKIKSTKIKLKTIANALDVYLIQNNKLPCPAGLKKSTGIALNNCATTDATNGVFVSNSVARGWVPYETLNISPDNVYDDWGNKIAYTVAVNTTSNFNKLSNSFIGISVYNDSKSKLITSKAIYSLNSHGKNALGAYNKSNNQISTTNISNEEKINIASSTVNNNEFLYFNNLKKYDDLGIYTTKFQVIIDNKINNVSCYITQDIVSQLLDDYGAPSTCNFDDVIPADNFLHFDYSINSSGNNDCKDKYKIMCLKYGRLGVMRND